MQYSDFEEAIKGLIEDGAIYTSIDEDTYGLTDWKQAGRRVKRFKNYAQYKMNIG